MWERYELKEKAKRILQRSYWKCFGAVLICNAVGMIINNLFFAKINNNQLQEMTKLQTMSEAELMRIYDAFINNWELVLSLSLILSILSFIINMFVITPLNVGLCKFFNENAREKTNLGNVFFAFSSGAKNYFNIIKTNFLKSVFISLWGMLSIALFTVLMFGVIFLLGYSFAVSLSPTLMFIVSMILPLLFFIIAFIPVLVKTYQYFMVNYILADNPEISARNALKKSKQLMKGEVLKTVLLTVSFFGWTLIGSAIFLGLGTFFVTPYIKATYTELYLRLKTKVESSEPSQNAEI